MKKEPFDESKAEPEKWEYDNYLITVLFRGIKYQVSVLIDLLLQELAEAKQKLETRDMQIKADEDVINHQIDVRKELEAEIARLKQTGHSICRSCGDDCLLGDEYCSECKKKKQELINGYPPDTLVCAGCGIPISRFDSMMGFYGHGQQEGGEHGKAITIAKYQIKGIMQSIDPSQGNPQDGVEGEKE